MNRISDMFGRPAASYTPRGRLSPGANTGIPLREPVVQGDGLAEAYDLKVAIMTVLVTGGAGYIGSHMVHALADAGERAVVLDNLSTGFDWAVAEGVPIVVGESGDQPLVAKLIAEHGVDAVIHFAASIVVPDSVADPLGYYRNNTVNSRALIETAIKGGVRHFIF